MKYSQAIIIAALTSAAVVSASQPKPGVAHKGVPGSKHGAARTQGHFHTAKFHAKAPAASKSKRVGRIAKGVRKAVSAAINAAGGHENAAMSAAAVYSLYKNRKSQGGAGGYNEYQRRAFTPKAKKRIHHRIGGAAGGVNTPNYDTRPSTQISDRAADEIFERDIDADEFEEFLARRGLDAYSTKVRGRVTQGLRDRLKSLKIGITGAHKAGSSVVGVPQDAPEQQTERLKQRDFDDLEYLDARDLDGLEELVARGRLGGAFSKIIHAVKGHHADAATNAANVDPQAQPEQRDFDYFDELELRDFDFEIDELD